ncbi:MAG: metallophosphoesterase [Rhodoferax sp.]
MKIQLLSDLHLEVHPALRPAPAAGADVLVLAGDIGSYQKGSLLQGDCFGLERFSPRHGWPVPVVYVPGNHEYDLRDFDETHARLQEVCTQLGIHWLERETVVLGGVRFVGTTGWSDFDALGPAPEQPGATLGQQLAAREKAFRAANYYLRTTGAVRAGEPLLAAQVRELALTCRAWLEQALAQPFGGRTVVVTHFAPSLRSADPRYGCTPGTAGFCNAWDDLLPAADLWLHGHLHAPSDYRQQGCRVVANPLGYVRKNEQAGFRADLLIDTDQDAPGGRD